MKLVRLLALGAVVAASQGCTPRDTTGSVVALDPLAGLRYVNLVADTGAMDFRIIDIVGDAPNSVGASFRTGGAPNGITNPIPSQPPYVPVRAGARHIRVFMNGTTAAIASTIMFDTTFTFVTGTNYTMFLYGNARVVGGVKAVITADVVPTIPTPVLITNSTMNAMTTAADTIFASGGSGSWITQGVKVGNDITLTNHATAGNNSRMFRVVSVTATKIALLGTPLTVNAVPDSSFTLTILGKVASRVIHLGPSMTGATTSFPSPAVDVYADTLAAATAPAGTPQFGTVILGEVRPYVFLTARTALGANPALNYRAAMTGAGGPAATFVQVDVPTGAVGTSTANPVAGEIVVGTAFTIVIAPRAEPGSAAVPAGNPVSFQNPSVFFIMDRLPDRTAP